MSRWAKKGRGVPQNLMRAGSYQEISSDGSD